MGTQLTPSKFDEILAAVPQIVIEVDLDLRIKFLNRGVAPFFVREVVPGDFLLGVVTPDAADAIVDAIDNAERIGRSLSEYRTGNTVYGVSAKPLDSAAGTLLIIEGASQFDGPGSTVRDLLRSHQRFLSAIRYDLANPLSAVTGCAGVLLESGSGLNEETRSSLVRHMNEEAYNLTSTLDDLRTAISLELGQLELAEIEFDALESIAAVINGLGTRGRSIEVSASGPVPLVGDPVRFTQIIRSLLVNSLSHGPGGIVVSASNENGKAVVSVSDQGELISSDFSRPGDQKPSTYPVTPRKVGLGLWVSKELAAAMGGSLRMNHMGTEVKFRLSLPA